MGSIPRSRRSPGVGDGNPLQYSCLENPMDRGIWYATVHGITKNWTLPSMHAHTVYGETPYNLYSTWLSFRKKVMDFLWTFLVAQMVKHLCTMWEDSWRRKWQPTPVLLPWKSHGRRSLVQATIHGVAKSQAQLSNFTFTFLLEALFFSFKSHQYAYIW